MARPRNPARGDRERLRLVNERRTETRTASRSALRWAYRMVRLYPRRHRRSRRRARSRLPRTRFEPRHTPYRPRLLQLLTPLAECWVPLVSAMTHPWVSPQRGGQSVPSHTAHNCVLADARGVRRVSCLARPLSEAQCLCPGQSLYDGSKGKITAWTKLIRSGRLRRCLLIQLRSQRRMAPGHRRSIRRANDDDFNARHHPSHRRHHSSDQHRQR